jgi:DNA-binding XRE family transcriptional regulator
MVMGSDQSTAATLLDNPPKSRAGDVDRAIGHRIRERRIMLGLTQHQFAELVGVTYQQAHKYEKGFNRIAAGRLLAICDALSWSVGECLAGINQPQVQGASMRRRMMMGELFARLDDRRADAVLHLVRALAGEEEGGVTDMSETAEPGEPFL